MAENDAERDIEQIATELADAIYWEQSAHHRPAHLKELLIEFAEEIQRRSIEP